MNASTFRARILIIAAACGGALGCGNEPVNIGDGAAIDKNSLSSYIATWDGYVEAHTFLDGSDRVRVTIDANGMGFLLVGDGDALALPTDPNVGWPPSVATANASSIGATLYPGYRYPLGDMRIESARVRFQIETNDAFGPFCALQAPVPSAEEAGRYGCFPYSIASGSTGSCLAVLEPNGDFEPVECGKAHICIEGCECDATSCSTIPGRDVPLDAALSDSGDELVGTIILEDENVGARTVRLERQ